MFEQLTDEGLIDRMYRSFKRFQSVHPFSPYIAAWKKWIRQ